MKFQNRVDYVNIKAYDAGRIDVENYKKPKTNSGDLYDFDNSTSTSNLEGIILKKIESFDQKGLNIKQQICCLAKRHDEKLMMAMGKAPID